MVYKLTIGSGGSRKNTVLYEFSRNGGDGASPMASIVFDAAGNLYSTTNGGTSSSPRGNVFRLRPPAKKAEPWTLNVLHNFAGPPDGTFPAASVIFDKQGNLYSTTVQGGNGTACSGGCGTVFEVSP